MSTTRFGGSVMSLQHRRRAFTLVEFPAVSRVKRSGFTLVELLVVIGIIALLISVLLPALSRARKSAASVKCAASLREIGNALRMYSIDSKGWYPVAKLTITGGSYSLHGSTHAAATPPYWFNFLTKYVTKANMGYSVVNSSQQQDAQRSIFWACPEWQGYASTSAVGVSTVQPGYGMNGWPTFNPGYPKTASSFPPSDVMVSATNPECNVVGNYNNGKWTLGNFFKEKIWTRNGSNRIVVADSRFWLAESQRLTPGPGNSVVFPPQANINNSETYTSGVTGQTLIDVYRHGKYPPMASGMNAFATTGGKVGYNCLWADGHVSTEVTQEAAYKGIRFRIPN